MRTTAAMITMVGTIAGALPAQSYTLSGVVRSAVDSSPLYGASVTVVGHGRATTDSGGRFRFRSAPSGRLELRVRRLGFQPFARYVRTEEAIPPLLIALTPIPVELKEVRVAGRLVRVPPGLEDVYRRAASGFGHLITPEEIELRQAYHVKELLSNVPGVFIDIGKIRFRRCGDPNNQRSPDRPKVQVYIDGDRVTRFDKDQTNADEALSQVAVSHIVAIEVFTGVAQIPGEYHVDACAVVAIWTKRGRYRDRPN